VLVLGGLGFAARAATASRFRLVEEPDRFTVVLAGTESPSPPVYRAAPGRRPASELAERELGAASGVAFIERYGERFGARVDACELVVVVHRTEPAQPMRWRLPRCAQKQRPFWIGSRRITVGRDPLTPEISVSFQIGD
jgi:hypothetical protein